MRRGVLRVGDRVRHAGQDCTVTGLSGSLVRLVAEDGAESVLALTRLQTSPDFVVIEGEHAASLPGLGLLAGVPEDALARARWWEQHLLEIETGQRRDGSATREPDDTEHTTIEQRELAKIEELAAIGFTVSHRTLQRYRSAYTAAGLWGLVDHRATRGSCPTGRVDGRVVEAVRSAMVEQVDRSTGTRTRLRRRVEALLDEQHGPGAVPLPPRTTFYRLLGAVEAGQHTFGPATTRRSLANRPTGPFGTVLAVRPGELVQIDTTPLDVMALLEDGVSARVELTILVDLATRTICSGLLRPHATKAVDAALLLARALVPEPMRPGWPDALAMRVSRLPHTELAAADARLADAAAKPVITPETIVCDRGAVFISETFLAACARLGISLQPAHPHTPTDKGVVERTFSSINTLFCQHVAGYTGRDTTRRGRDVAGQAVWSLAQLQDLFDQWVLAGWQTRPHDGLRHPELPRSALSPNEMYAAQIAAAGYLPLALSGSDYLELLAGGRVVAEGTAIELARRFARDDEVRYRLHGHAYSHHVADSTGYVRELFAAHGEAISDLEVHRARLEDTYLAMVRHHETGVAPSDDAMSALAAHASPSTRESSGPRPREGGRVVNPRGNAILAGLQRGRIEFGQSLRRPSEPFSWVFFPGVSLLVMFFLRDTTVPGLGLSLGSQAIPGIIGMTIVFIGTLGLSMALTVDRGDGTLLRAKATPHGVLGYLVGKITSQAGFCTAIIAMILIVGGFLFDGLDLGNATTWLMLIWVLALGLAATLPLGAIFGSLFTNPQSLGLISLVFMGLVAISGVFYPITTLPGWLQTLGQFFPVYWLGLGMRAALLPETAAAAEIGASWRHLETLLALGAWTTAGFLIAPLVLHRMARRASGATITTDPRQAIAT